jgi:sulfonate transport system substrate-binding protein
MSFADPRRLHRTLTLLLAAVLTATLAACGSSPSSGGNGSGNGVNIKVSYQTADFPALLKASGLFENLPYSYEVPIINGPASQLAALYGKQIDVGEAGDNTGAFEVANAANPWTKESAPIQGFAVQYTPGAPYPSPAVYVTKSSGIKTLADLRGKKVGYNYGGNIYAGYVVALQKGGFGPDDVQGVQFPANQAAANAFNAGDLDAVVSSYYLVKKKVDSGDAVLIADPQSLGIIGGGGWLARTDSLNDPAKLAAIKDFFGRLRKVYEEWIPAHEAEYEKLLDTVLNQTPDVAKVNWQNNTHLTFYRIGDPRFLKIQQDIVDAAHQVGGLKTNADAGVGYTTILDPVTTG